MIASLIVKDLDLPKFVRQLNYFIVNEAGIKDYRSMRFRLDTPLLLDQIMIKQSFTISYSIDTPVL